MDNFNRILSFIIGLVVVVVIVAIIANRINVRRRVSNLTQSISKTVSTTPTRVPTITPVYSPTPTTAAAGTNRSRYTTPQPTQIARTKGGLIVTTTPPNKIPSTGAPTLLLPLSMAGMFMGVYLRKKS